jgi:hypothetical protein
MPTRKSPWWKALLLIAALALGGTLSCAYRVDRDNNPPGPVGGPGSNWENPPGPAGGPGTSPDRRRYSNPPGPVGGTGYGPAWEAWFARHPGYRDKVDLNNDGYIDGREWRIAQYNLAHLNPPQPGDGRWWDRDDNPPGQAGGPGTNWENPPGPAGGPGTSPDRVK